MGHKGDMEYLFTYYKKNREERASDYAKVMPALSVFSACTEPSAREAIKARIHAMDVDELAKLQEFLGTANARPASRNT